MITLWPNGSSFRDKYAMRYSELLEAITTVKTGVAPDVKALYHFTNVKGLIGILRSDGIHPGHNGRVSFTFNPAQSLFRYTAAVLIFDASLGHTVKLIRYQGDAASLAGGDEEEYYADTAVRPLLPSLRSVVIRPNIFDDGAKAFAEMYRITKQQLRTLLQSWQTRGVDVVYKDFNDTETL